MADIGPIGRKQELTVIGDYLRQHITHGYAVTVHSAQGVTADTTHAVLGENTTPALLYVALTRGRDTDTAYLYERIAGETEHEHADEPGLHVLRRGASRAQLVRTIIATHDDQARTAHDIAADAAYREQLPERVQSLLTRSANAVQRRRAAYQHWQDEIVDLQIERKRALDQHLSGDRSREQSLD